MSLSDAFHKANDAVLRFLRKNRQNVFYELASRTQRYKQFERDLSRALYKQITRSVNLDVLQRVRTEVSKVDKTIVDKTLVVIELYWSTLDNNVDMKSFDDFLIAMANFGGKGALETLGVRGAFRLENEGFLKQIRDHRNLIITSIDDTGKHRLARVIADGMEQDIPNADILETIQREFPDVAAYRAERIVRTETVNAIEKTQREVYKRSGIEKLQWLTVRDDLVCAYCAPLDGEIVGWRNSFSSGKFDAVKHPPLHVNCRCDLLPVIERGEELKPWKGQ